MLRITDQAFKTDVGRQRNANEDSYFARSPVFVVADGMGGAQAGEVASQTATEVFDGGLGAGAPEAALERVVQEANQRIHRLAEDDPSTAGMGTTLTAAVLKPEEQEVAIAHVGDSRAYRLRSGKLEQLTTDHSLVEELRRKGQLTDEQASDHPQRSIITRALGPEAAVEVDKRTKRCAMPTMAQPGIDKDVDVLRSLARGRDLRLGVYARVVVPGQLDVGASVPVA